MAAIENGLHLKLHNSSRCRVKRCDSFSMKFKIILMRSRFFVLEDRKKNGMRNAEWILNMKQWIWVFWGSLWHFRDCGQSKLRAIFFQLFWRPRFTFFLDNFSKNTLESEILPLNSHRWFWRLRHYFWAILYPRSWFFTFKLEFVFQ